MVVEDRLYFGEAWMWCKDCSGKLYSFDGTQDQSIPCPTKEQCKQEKERDDWYNNPNRSKLDITT